MTSTCRLLTCCPVSYETRVGFRRSFRLFLLTMFAVFDTISESSHRVSASPETHAANIGSLVTAHPFSRPLRGILLHDDVHRAQRPTHSICVYHRLVHGIFHRQIWGSCAQNWTLMALAARTRSPSCKYAQQASLIRGCYSLCYPGAIAEISELMVSSCTHNSSHT